MSTIVISTISSNFRLIFFGLFHFTIWVCIDKPIFSGTWSIKGCKSRSSSWNESQARRTKGCCWSCRSCKTRSRKSKTKWGHARYVMNCLFVLSHQWVIDNDSFWFKQCLLVTIKRLPQNAVVHRKKWEDGLMPLIPQDQKKLSLNNFNTFINKPNIVIN